MAHFAKLNSDNIVEQVIVINNEVIENKPFPQSEPIGVAFCKSIYGQDTEWKQTSYNSKFRGRFAGPGLKYDAVKDEFILLEQATIDPSTI